MHVSCFGRENIDKLLLDFAAATNSIDFLTVAFHSLSISVSTIIFTYCTQLNWLTVTSQYACVNCVMYYFKFTSLAFSFHFLLFPSHICSFEHSSFYSSLFLFGIRSSSKSGCLLPVTHFKLEFVSGLLSKW